MTRRGGILQQPARFSERSDEADECVTNHTFSGTDAAPTLPIPDRMPTKSFIANAKSRNAIAVLA
jgi:hypothetical protein